MINVALVKLWFKKQQKSDNYSYVQKCYLLDLISWWWIWQMLLAQSLGKKKSAGWGGRCLGRAWRVKLGLGIRSVISQLNSLSKFFQLVVPLKCNIA